MIILTLIVRICAFYPMQNLWSENYYGPDFREIDCAILKAEIFDKDQLFGHWLALGRWFLGPLR